MSNSSKKIRRSQDKVKKQEKQKKHALLSPCTGNKKKESYMRKDQCSRILDGNETKKRKRGHRKINFVFPIIGNRVILFEFEKHGLECTKNKSDRILKFNANEDEKKNIKSNQSIDEILCGSEEKESTDNTSELSTEKQQLISHGNHEQTISGRLSGLSVEEALRDKHGCRPRANSTDGELNLPRRGLCDERMVIENHKWNIDEKKLMQTQPKGFVNMGNTCFLNSTLQCLAYLPPFCQCLLAMPDSMKHGQNGSYRKPSQGKRITLMLRSLFERVHGTASNQKKSTSIVPREIVKAIPTIGTCGRNGYKFRPGRQEDAHEFLVHLLDAMNDGELREAGINQHKSGWRDNLPVHRLDETTFIHRIFGGYLRSQVSCNLCKYNSNTYDPFLDLSLEVSQKSCNSVATAIAGFTRKETLDTENRWKCSGCGKRVCATKQLTVFRPPLSLCIQMKRFAFSGDSAFGGMNFGRYSKKGFGMRHGGTKITKPIEFPADLRLPLSDGRSCDYALKSIVIHIGGSASSGHYTAYVKKPGSNQWYHMDDSFVQPVSEKAVLKQKNAYVLFYCRKEVKMEFPSPPVCSMSTEQAKKLSRARAKARADSLSQDDRVQSAAEKRNKPPTKESTHTSETADQDKLKASPLQKKIAVKKNSLQKVYNPKPTNQLTDSTMHVDCSSSASVPKHNLCSNSLSSQSSDQIAGISNSIDNDRTKQQVMKVGTTSDEDSDTESSSAGSDSSSASPNPGSAKSDSTKEGSGVSSHTTKSDSNVNGIKTKPAVLSSMPSPGKNGDLTPGHLSLERTKKKKKKSANTRIVMGGGVHSKVMVMMGPRFKTKTWKPKTSGLSRGLGRELLGNHHVDKWDDDHNDHTSAKKAQLQIRSALVEKIENEARFKKRKMRLDRWDSILDEGKKSKKKRREDYKFNNSATDGTAFQRIQSENQLKNRGKPKGWSANEKSKR